jgi:hypothetical protein
LDHRRVGKGTQDRGLTFVFVDRLSAENIVDYWRIASIGLGMRALVKILNQEKMLLIAHFRGIRVLMVSGMEI